MRTPNRLLGVIAVAVFFTALSGWFFCLSRINSEFDAMHLRILPLLLAPLAAVAADALLVRRGVSLRLYLVVQALLVAGAAFLFPRCISLTPYKLRTVVLNCVLYCMTFPATAFAAYEPPKKESLLTLFDLSAAGIAVLLIIGSIRPLPALEDACVLGAVSLGCVLLALVAERAGRVRNGQESVRGSGAGGGIMLGVLFAAVVALTAGGAAVLSVGLQRTAAAVVAAMRWLLGAFLSAVRFLYRILLVIAEWLSGFLREQPGLDAPGQEMPMMPEFGMDQIPLTVPSWFLWVVVGIAAALFLLVLLLLRRRRLSRAAFVLRTQTVRARRSGGFGAALRSLLRKLCAALRFRALCILRRNTAAGLLVWCERHAPGPDARRTGESGEAFLRRLAEKPEASALRDLAALVERSFYAPGGAVVPAALRRSVRQIRFSGRSSRSEAL